MIGKIISPGATFGPCIKYLLEGSKADQEKLKVAGIEKATVLRYNFCFGNKQELTCQFNEVSELNKKVKSPVQHIILSFAPEDKINNNQMIEIAHKLSEKMDFDKHQYLAVKHNDTDHNHLHIVCNRISFEGKTLSDSNNYKKIVDFCREIEIDYDLRKVLSPKRFLPVAERDLPRSDVRIDHVEEIVKDALVVSNNFDELQYELLGRKILMELGRGITFIDEQKVRIKGSRIGYSKDKIEKYFFSKEKVSKSKTPTPVTVPLNENNNSSYNPMPTITPEETNKTQSVNESMKKIINTALNISKSWSGFQSQLLFSEIKIEKSRAIAFIDGESNRTKGSDLGFSLAQIEKYFVQKAERFNLPKSVSNNIPNIERAGDLLNSQNNPPQILLDEFKTTDDLDGIESLIETGMEALNKSNNWGEFQENLFDNQIMISRHNNELFFESKSQKIKGIHLGFSISKLDAYFEQKQIANELQQPIDKPAISIESMGDVKLETENITQILSHQVELTNLLDNNDALKQIVSEVLNKSNDWKDFRGKLLDNQIVIYTTDKDLIFKYENQKIRGSNIGFSSLQVETYFEKKLLESEFSKANVNLPLQIEKNTALNIEQGSSNSFSSEKLKGIINELLTESNNIEEFKTRLNKNEITIYRSKDGLFIEGREVKIKASEFGFVLKSDINEFFAEKHQSIKQFKIKL